MINVFMKTVDKEEFTVELNRFRVIIRNGETLLLGEIDEGVNYGRYLWSITDMSVDESNHGEEVFKSFSKYLEEHDKEDIDG